MARLNKMIGAVVTSKGRLVWFLALCPLLTHAAGVMRAENAWVLMNVPFLDVTPAYVVVVNHSDRVDRLVGAESASAESVEMFTTVLERGSLRTRKINTIDMPLGVPLQMHPNGPYLLLRGLRRSLRGGQRVPITLHFERSPPLVIRATVRRSVESNAQVRGGNTPAHRESQGGD